jgi:transcriptional regulator with GAF, ATPase, and Fis domain
MEEIEMGTRGPLESKVFDSLRKEGYTIHESGWPDCLAIGPDGEGCFIEVKDKSDRLWDNQQKMLVALESIGLRVFVVGHLRKIPRSMESGEIVVEGNLDEQMRKAEREAIQKALELSKGRAKNAAKLLGITYESLRYRIGVLGIKRWHY